MGKFKKKPRKVLTPGSYQAQKDKNKRKDKDKNKRQDKDRNSKSSPGRKKAFKGTARKDNYRSKYTKDDMDEAVRLVREEKLSVKKASVTINEKKKNAVPRMTLNDRMNRSSPDTQPKVGRPEELPVAVEEAIVKCLVLCGEYQYPMKKRDLQLLVQSYCVENNIQTRWKDSLPRKDWVYNFQQRWKDKIKIRKPTNIKRSRAKVSPEKVRSFFTHLAPNLENVLPTHLFNYDESYFRDDPGAENAFFAVGSKYFEQVKNHSKTSYSVMFCCSAAGKMLSPG